MRVVGVYALNILAHCANYAIFLLCFSTLPLLFHGTYISDVQRVNAQLLWVLLLMRGGRRTSSSSRAYVYTTKDIPYCKYYYILPIDRLWTKTNLFISNNGLFSGPAVE